MAIIHNNTAQALSIKANEFSGFIAPRSSLEVPNDAARVWLKRETPAFLLSAGGIRVSGLEAEAPKAKAKEETETSEPKPAHWRTVLKQVSEMTDLDALMDLHSSETRPRIVSAIEARMAELQG